jgi:hypothetical protein
MRNLLAVYALICAVLLGAGCVSSTPGKPRPPHLVGSVSGNLYISQHGNFSVPFPVSPEIDGRILHDSAESVTFHDNWGSRITFYSAAFSSESSMANTLRDSGPQKALETFVTDQYGNLVEPHYHPEIRGGAVSLLFLRPVAPKMGVAAFISGNRVYWVTSDNLPGVQLLAQTDAASLKQQDQDLEKNALDLLQTMQLH